jgi:hypothetical protein
MGDGHCSQSTVKFWQNPNCRLVHAAEVAHHVHCKQTTSQAAPAKLAADEYVPEGFANTCHTT